MQYNYIIVSFLLSSMQYSPKCLNFLGLGFYLLCILLKFGFPCRVEQNYYKALPGESR